MAHLVLLDRRFALLLLILMKCLYVTFSRPLEGGRRQEAGGFLDLDLVPEVGRMKNLEKKQLMTKVFI